MRAGYGGGGGGHFGGNNPTNVVPHGRGEVGTTWQGEKGGFYEGGTTL